MPTFREDIKPLLVQGTKINFDQDFDLVMNRVISKLSGDPWKGEKS
jgi:hypothetical protein